MPREGLRSLTTAEPPSPSVGGRDREEAPLGGGPELGTLGDGRVRGLGDGWPTVCRESPAYCGSAWCERLPWRWPHAALTSFGEGPVHTLPGCRGRLWCVWHGHGCEALPWKGSALIVSVAWACMLALSPSVGWPRQLAP